MIDLMKPKMIAHFANDVSEVPVARKGKLQRLVSKLHRRLAQQRPATQTNAIPDKISRLAQEGRASGLPVFDKPCLVGTFHKTGTMLAVHILSEIAAHTDLRLWNIGQHPDQHSEWDLGFHWWSDFADHGIDPTQHPTAVIIRDPRDVIASGMKFHCLGKEPWLCEPDQRVNGRTYQEALLDLPSDEARYHFELQHQAGATIHDMLALRNDPRHRDTLFLPLEDLMTDQSLTPFKRLFQHLGMNEPYIPLALAVANKHSVFNPQFKRTHHITSGRPAVWRSALNQSVLDALEEQHPNAVTDLGYPSS